MLYEYTYPGGKAGCITFSYDDGRDFDRRLVDIFNRYGIKGSFHLNSANLGCPGYVTAGELPELYAGHEVSLHCLTHPFPSRIPSHRQLSELTADKAALEAAWGHIISSMSFPFGDYNDHFLKCMDASGVLYGRTTRATRKFSWPEDFRVWDPTCHHNDDLLSLLAGFRRYSTGFKGMALFYIWGHSYEFNDAGNWDMIESFCKEAGNDPDTWYATGLEIYDYITSLRRLRISADGCIVVNPSALTLWGRDERGALLQILPGENRFSPCV